MEEFDDNQAMRILESELESENANLAITKLQGTDGVRGQIVATSDEPLADFVSYNKMSPEFVELYCYTWLRILSEDGVQNKNIAIAKDSRDPDNSFINAAIKAIHNAGFQEINLGIMPTPAVPFAILTKNAAGGIMLSASHNPADQQGIKLFDNRGLKYLPDFDLRHTSLIKSVNYSSISTNKNPHLSVNKILNEQFINFLKSKINLEVVDFEKYNLVIDCANGSASEIVAEIFSDFKKLHIINADISAKINDFCGVAEFEEIAEISAKEFAENIVLKKNKTLKYIFELAKKEKDIIAIVLDGDADRFIALDYLAAEKKIMVLGGDKIVSFFISDPKFKNQNKTIVNTIESDFSVYHLAKSYNWNLIMQSVGDKWVSHELLNHIDKSYTIGYEESGHFIFPAIVNKKYLLSGNGILAAAYFLNFRLSKNYSKINDYISGARLTLSLYYVDKSKLASREFKKEIENFLSQSLNKLKQFNFEKKDFPLETDLIYFDIVNSDNKNIGNLFIRNSGTENKASINLRLDKKYYQQLLAIQNQLFVKLWFDLKNFDEIENKIIKETLIKFPKTNETLLKYPRYKDKIENILFRKEQLLIGDRLTEVGVAIKNKLEALS